jgi:hypothetical protein
MCADIGGASRYKFFLHGFEDVRMKQSFRLPGFSGFLRFSEKAMLVAGMTIGFAAPALAQSPVTHVHGQAVLEVAVDGGAVQLNLYSPLDNLLGFEHAPRTEEERRAVRTMAAKLHQGESLFVFAPSARCRLESSSLQSTSLSPELLTAVPRSVKSQGATAGDRGDEASKPASSRSAPHAHEAYGAHGAYEDRGAHAELEAVWVFRCSTPQALQELDVGLFRAFPALQRLDAAVAGPRKQSSARLTPQSIRLQWR